MRFLERKRLLGPFTAALLALTSGVAYAQPNPSKEPSPAKEPAPSADDPGELPMPGDPPPPDDPTKRDPVELPPMEITPDEEPPLRTVGPAVSFDEEELQRFEDDDVHRHLGRVAGVYIRGEDGYGLRPNIGMRGAASDRSKKITLLEDGVLFGPAPYSAPAAYFFPLMTRMTGMDIFKGPATLRYGPQTVGGAIDLRTREVPGEGHALGADVALGTTLFNKIHGHYGYGAERWGVLAEVVRLRSDGFKELSTPAGESLNTGFQKTEVMLKARVNNDPDASWYHEGGIKLGFSHEKSNETYLGLTDSDFEATPFRRYAASELDNMEYQRFQIELSHKLEGEGLRLVTKAYRHDFQRDWFKLNRFAGGPDLKAILDAPTSGQNAVFYSVLTGQADSSSASETLLVGNNGRTFVSTGVQSRGEADLPKLGPVEQKLRFGARYHFDSIERNHTEDSFVMRSGELVSDGAAQAITLQNTGRSHAVALHLVDEVSAYGLTLTPGVRFEYIAQSFEQLDPIAGTASREQTSQQRIIVPGVGLTYQPIDQLTLLAGVYEGYSPVSPGQPEDVEAEVSVNYEWGARFAMDKASVEVVGFFNDYANLTGECTASSGCADTVLGAQFNGGEVNIMGLEASAAHEIETKVGLTIPLRATYTLTTSEFLTSFVSDNPLFGDVQEGDELPYVPRHQASLTAGVHMKRWGLHATGRYLGSMWEAAGQGDAAAGLKTDEYAVFDAIAYVNPFDEMQVYAKLDNIGGAEYILSRRPFGARPGRPRFFLFGIKAEMR